MPAYAIDRRDVAFVLYEHLGVEGLTSLPPFAEQGRELYDSALAEAHKLARDVLYPANVQGDRERCTLRPDGSVAVPASYRDAYRAFVEGGWVGASAPAEHGGMGLPHSVGIAIAETFMGAAPAFMMYPGLNQAAVNLLARYGAPWMRERVLPKLLSGEWQGTMALTEPQAGSAVGALTTRALPEGDRFLLEGEKIFISCGEHDLTENHVHLVLARIPGDPGGTKGISIFLCSKRALDPETGALGASNHVRCTGIEHKMGIHGSATCALLFGAGGPSIAHLIGEPRQGLRIMFTMMNEARIATGMQGMAQAGVAYEMARAYARERVQGTRPDQWDAEAPEAVAIDQHPDVRRMLLDMKATVEATRALLYGCAYHADLAEHAADPEARERSRGRVELLTPICKAFASDQAFRVAETAIQVLGGYGYCTDYGVEQYCRDTKISSIYEGTNGIQALDLLGRKLGMKGGSVFMAYADDLNQLVERAGERPELADIAAELAKVRGRLLEVAMKFMAMGQGGDRLYPVLCATPFLELMGYVVGGQLLLEQALVATRRLAELAAARGSEPEALARKDPEAAFYAGKVASARYWAHWRLPRVHAIAKGILSEDRSPLGVF